MCAIDNRLDSQVVLLELVIGIKVSRGSRRKHRVLIHWHIHCTQLAASYSLDKIRKDENIELPTRKHAKLRSADLFRDPNGALLPIKNY